MKKNLFQAILVASSLTALAACGGGGSGGTDSITTSQAGPKQAEDGTLVYPASPKERTQGPVDAGQADRIVQSVDEFSVRTALEHLTGMVEAPLSSGGVKIAERGGTQGRAYARQYVREWFVSHGLTVKEHPFTKTSSTTGKKYEGVNVEGVIEGQPGGKHLYVTGHLDSVNNVGANDDASGIVAMMLAARALSDHQPRDTIHFVAFDLEELGLWGSAAYVRDLVLPLKTAGAGMIGDIQLDMVGHNSMDGLLVASGCAGAASLVGAMTEAVSEHKLVLNIESKACTDRSDHESFSDESIPAVLAIDDQWYGEYPWYHQPTDTFEKVDLNHLTQVARTAAGAAIRLAYDQ